MALQDVLVGDWHTAARAAVKVVLLFAVAVVAFRLTERRTLAEFAPFDWVAAVAVGAIVGRTATAGDTSWLTGTVALVALLLVHSALARLRFLAPVRRMVDPPLRVLVRDGRVERGNLRRCGLVEADLDGILRQQGGLALADVHLAIFESKGSVSAVPRRAPGP
ncbi:YetF domain-containing protein [Modestobacter sp. SYSU DS0511]